MSIQGVNLFGRGGREDVREDRRKKTNQNILYKKTIFNKRKIKNKDKK